VLFVKLIYELISIPQLEPQFVRGFAHSLIHLLKKRELLSRADLVLPWRPLYNLIEKVKYSKERSFGLYRCPQKFIESLQHLLRTVRVYFSADSTTEMLAEWRPLLCPFDAVMSQGIYFLSYFLPTCLMPEEHVKGFELWFKELIDYWVNCTHHVPESQEDLMKLFARLAEENVGFIDWTQYIPKIFNRFLSGLHLPVGKAKSSYHSSFELLAVSTTARWIVYMINTDNGCLDHLSTLFKALESFYHPSNYGRHSIRLLKFLCQLTDNFIKRLHRERYRKPNWMPKPPEHARLKDSDVERFVVILKPVAMLAVYSKSGSFDAAASLQNLALIKPDLILPSLIERTFEALGAVIEPHQVVATLSCVTSIARSLVSDEFPGGQLHVLALLRLALPGIDPNDFRKSMSTFTLISSIVSLIPLVDCSEALVLEVEMTEHEKELCAISAHFEDFVLEFLDRCFNIIDNSVVEQVNQEENIIENMDTQEGIIGMGLASTLHTVLIQSSPTIFSTALQRLFNYCESRVMEVTVAGKMVSDMVRAAVKAYPALTMKKFLPHCLRVVKNMTSAEGIEEEETVDSELLWNLEILSELVRCTGKELLPYIPQFEEIINSTLPLKCKKAYARSAKILKGILTFLSQIYPDEWRSTPETFDLPPDKHLYVRDWGKLGEIHELEMHWHIPALEELETARRLLEKVLYREMNKLKECMDGKQFTRDQIYQTLHIIVSCISGASCLLKTWNEEPRIKSIEPQTMVPRERRFNVTTITQNENMFSEITRKDIALLIHKFFQYLLEKQEDDTKAFHFIIKIYNYLILYHGVERQEFDMRWTSTSAVKKTLEDKLHRKKKHARAILIERVQLQHDMRLLERQSTPLTKMDKLLIDDLLVLATSVYTEVRIKAQKMLFACFDMFDYSARAVLPDVLKKLKDDPDVSHEAFKGSVHILLNNRMQYLVTHYWKMMVEAWPKIIEADHSEKPSMVKIIDKLIDSMQTTFDCVGIHRTVTADCEAAAIEILKSSSPIPAPEGKFVEFLGPALPSEELIKQATEIAEAGNNERKELYHALVSQLAGKVEANNLRWRHVQICVNLLILQIRYDINLPPCAVRVFANLLSHDALAMRKRSIKAIGAILFQQKKKHSKAIVDLAGQGYDISNIAPGIRPDNEWLLYKVSNVPSSETEWNNFKFVDKTHIGYYAWPKSLYTFAPREHTKEVDRTDATEEEMAIYHAFTSEAFIAKVVSFMSLEEKKGKDAFSGNKFHLFHGIFRNVGPVLLPLFKPVLEKLLNENQESSHRCATEIIAGLIRGSKHWNFHQLQDMWSFLLPLLRKTFSNIIPEALQDWAAAFVTATESLDPHRFRDLFDFLLDKPVNGDGGAFGDAARLVIAQSTIIQQEWRVLELNHTFFEYLIPHLSHTYKSVRDRIGSIYSYILMFGIKFHNSTLSASPKMVDLVNHVMGYLELLNSDHLQSPEATIKHDVEMLSIDEKSATAKKLQASTAAPDSAGMVQSTEEEGEERKKALRIAKTVLTVLSSQPYTLQSISKETFKLLPLLMPLESQEDDPEVQECCKFVFSKLPEQQLQDELIPTAVAMLVKMSSHGSWNVRRLVLRYLQIMVFHNMFTLKAVEYRQDICQLVVRLINDEQLEVRLEATKALSGLVHYGYIDVDNDLHKQFSQMARTGLTKRKRGESEANQGGLNHNASALRRRHAGVLGLSACILAFPYEVPEWMPQMLMEVGEHLHDRTNIEATVKKTLSEFRRTHHDNWQEHKQKFKDDQLAMLTDLLVSPNYYA